MSMSVPLRSDISRLLKSHPDYSIQQFSQFNAEDLQSLDLFRGSISQFGSELFHISVAQPQFTHDQAVTLLHTLMQTMHRIDASYSRYSRSAPSMTYDDFSSRYVAVKIASSLSASSVVDLNQKQTAYFNASKSAVKSMFFPQVTSPIEQLDLEADFFQDLPEDFSSESLATDIALVTAASIKTPQQAQVVFEQVSVNLPAIQQNLNAQGIKTTNNVAATLTKLSLIFTQLFPGFVAPSAYAGQLFQVSQATTTVVAAPVVQPKNEFSQVKKVITSSSPKKEESLETTTPAAVVAQKDSSRAIADTVKKAFEHDLAAKKSVEKSQGLMAQFWRLFSRLLSFV